MPVKRKSPLAVKIIACLLLLGSLAAVFLPSWLKLSADVGPDQVRMNPGEIIEVLKEDVEGVTGFSWPTIKQLFWPDLQEEYGISVTLETLTAPFKKPVDRLLDGHFSLPGMGMLVSELAELCSEDTLGTLTGQIPALTREFPEVKELTGELSRASGLLKTLSLGLYLAVALLAVLGVVGVICQLTDHPWGILPYFLVGLLYTVGLLLLRKTANDYLTANLPAWKSYCYEFVNAETGDMAEVAFFFNRYLGYLDAIDLGGIVKMGIGADLCPFLTLLAMLLSFIRKKQPAPIRRAAAPGRPRSLRPATPLPGSRWRPWCGSARSAASATAPTLSAARPAAWIGRTCPSNAAAPAAARCCPPGPPSATPAAKSSPKRKQPLPETIASAWADPFPLYSLRPRLPGGRC